MSRALLDVNFLLPLFDQEHIKYASANAWLAEHRDFGWATCALTENGFVRVFSSPSYDHPIRPVEAASVLREATQVDGHDRWSDDVSILDPEAFDHTRLHGHRQVTDAYLLALAVKHDGRLVTFDRSIPLSTVRGAESHHLVVL